MAPEAPTHCIIYWDALAEDRQPYREPISQEIRTPPGHALEADTLSSGSPTNKQNVNAMNSEQTQNEATEVTIAELTPETKRANVTAKVLSVTEAREIPNRFGPTNRVAEATVGDSSGTVVMSLWNEQIGAVNEGDSIRVENGSVSLLRGHIRLNVGKYGRLVPAEAEIEDVNEDVNLSDAEHEQPEKPRRGGRGGGGGGGGDRNYGGGGGRGGDRNYGGGGGDRGGSYGGGGRY
jgi:replication factor A1